MERFLGFDDLVQAGVVTNRVTLSRWQDERGFPRPVPIGKNTRKWKETEVLAWLAEREAERDGKAVAPIAVRKIERNPKYVEAGRKGARARWGKRAAPESSEA